VQPETAEPTPRRVVWRALWTSRLVVIFAGMAGVTQIGLAPGAASVYDPSGLTTPFGYLPNAIVAPMARWDSVWYLTIARYGYQHVYERTAFFPLYPLLIHLLGFIVRSDLIAGILVSLACTAAALTLLHRLVSLDQSREVADTTVLLVAFFPVSFFLSAVYTEGLLLALALACVYAARRERWLLCGLAGALASATAVTGLALVIPAAWIYLYGPRAASGPPKPTRSGRARLIPRHRLRVDVLALALIPLGMVAYLAYLGLRYGEPFAPLNVQSVWYRHTTLPFTTVWDAARQAWEGLRQLLRGPVPPYRVPAYAQAPISAAFQDIYLFLFLIAGLAGLVYVAFTLTPAYSLYTLALFVLVLAAPVSLQPLASLPRFELVMFPLFIAAARWLTRRRLAPYAIPALAVALGLFTVEFATWHWVA
jgi:hypothetical protein